MDSSLSSPDTFGLILPRFLPKGKCFDPPNVFFHVAFFPTPKAPEFTREEKNLI
jgi:hypothetical protein